MHRGQRSARSTGRRVALVASLVLAAGLAACSDSSPTAEPASTSGGTGLQSTGECPYTVTGQEIECGELIVAENHDESGGATISLPYLVLPATAGDRSAEPMVYLQGGPGASTFESIGDFASFSEVRRDRDIIFLEQRGTGVAEPFLGCGAEDAEGLQVCYDNFVADGVDLSQYTTLNAAKDLAVLRNELGIERWHLLGISYGTSLAMVAMDHDPDGVASVILDSPSAPSVVIMNADVESLLDVTAQILADCSTDADCSGRYAGDLFDQHLANFEGLKDDPWTVENQNLQSLFQTGSRVDAETYLWVGFDIAENDPGGLPGYVAAVAARDEDSLLAVEAMGWGVNGTPSTVIEILADCEADAECSSLNPDLIDKHQANLDDLRDEPWKIDHPNLRILFFGDEVGNNIYDGVSGELAREQPEALPGYVTAVAARDEDALLAVEPLGWSADRVAEEEGDENENDSEPTGEDVTGDDETGDDAAGGGFAEILGLPEGREDSFGYHLSVYCSEDQPYFDLETNPYVTEDEWPAEVLDTLLPPYEEQCAVWQVDPADAGDVDQIDSDIPTLILAGQYDALTPLRQGEIAAAGLTNAEVLEVPSTGHGTIGNECARSIMADFMRTPGGDRSCLTDIAPIEWK